MIVLSRVVLGGDTGRGTKEDEPMATYVERVDGHTDRWDDAIEPIVMLEEGILRIVGNDRVLSYYAAGQWVTTYDDTARPVRVP